MSDSDDGEFYGVGRKTEPGKLFPSMPNKASKKGQKGKGKRPRGTSDGGEDGEDDSPQRRKEEREERRSKKAASIREEKGTPFGGGGMKFSEAFTKILKTAEQVVGQAAPAFVAAASSSKPSKQAALSLPAAAASLPAPILAGSRTVQKRAADEKAERARLKASRRRKRELRAAGHAPPKPRGAEPERDALERRLLVTATKGVVQLFNAVARVQRAARDGDATKAKATFVEELKRQAGGDRPARGGAAGPSADAAAAAAAAGPGGGAKGTGWAVLSDGFGVGRGKLKDWDAGREEAGEEEVSDSDLGGDD